MGNADDDAIPGSLDETLARRTWSHVVAIIAVRSIPLARDDDRIDPELPEVPQPGIGSKPAHPNRRWEVVGEDENFQPVRTDWMDCGAL